MKSKRLTVLLFPYQELFEAFECAQNKDIKDSKRRDGCSHKFSLDVVSALRKLLLRAPQRAKALLEFFQGEQGTHSSSPQQYHSLQNIFVEFLCDSLKSLQSLQSSSELSVELDQRELVDTIYAALSVVTFEVEHQADEVKHLFRELLDVCWAEGSPLREEKLLNCMLRKQSHSLLSLYSNVLTERTREKFLLSKSIQKGLFHFLLCTNLLFNKTIQALNRQVVKKSGNVLAKVP